MREGGPRFCNSKTAGVTFVILKGLVLPKFLSLRAMIPIIRPTCFHCGFQLRVEFGLSVAGQPCLHSPTSTCDHMAIFILN